MLEERLHCVTDTEPEEEGKQIETVLQETTAEVVGLSTRKHQDWFDEADKKIKQLLKKKRSCHNHLLAKPDDKAAKAAYKTACSTLQANLRTMQNDWCTGPAQRTQWYADMGDMRTFNKALKAVLRTLTSDPSPSKLFRWKYPAHRQGSNPPALVRAFQMPLQRSTHCRSLHWPRFPKWT